MSQSGMTLHYWYIGRHKENKLYYFAKKEDNGKISWTTNDRNATKFSDSIQAHIYWQRELGGHKEMFLVNQIAIF